LASFGKILRHAELHYSTILEVLRAALGTLLGDAE
jgi:hypothetical protein